MRTLHLLSVAWSFVGICSVIWLCGTVFMRMRRTLLRCHVWKDAAFGLFLGVACLFFHEEMPPMTTNEFTRSVLFGTIVGLIMARYTRNAVLAGLDRTKREVRFKRDSTWLNLIIVLSVAVLSGTFISTSMTPETARSLITFGILWAVLIHVANVSWFTQKLESSVGGPITIVPSRIFTPLEETENQP